MTIMKYPLNHKHFLLEVGIYSITFGSELWTHTHIDLKTFFVYFLTEKKGLSPCHLWEASHYQRVKINCLIGLICLLSDSLCADFKSYHRITFSLTSSSPIFWYLWQWFWSAIVFFWCWKTPGLTSSLSRVTF